MRGKALKKITAWLIIICMLAGIPAAVGMPMAIWAKEAGVGQQEDDSTVTDEVYGVGSNLFLTLSDPAAGGAAIVTIETPDTIKTGQPFDVTVTVVEDVYGNPGSGYTGTMAFASSDPQALLPERYTFTESDQGSKVFEDLVFSKYGDVNLWVSEVYDGSPEAYWRFDEEKGAVITDFSGGNNGMLFNAGSGISAWMAPGNPAIQFSNPSCLKLDGVNDYIDAGSGIYLAGRSFSIAFWAKRDVLEEGWIVSQGAIVQNIGLHVGFSEPNKFKFAFWNDDLDVTISENSGWHHWAVTFDSSTKRQRVYLDGTEAGSGISADVLQSSGSFYIGKRFDGRGHFNGSIDDLRVYSRVLPSEEIDVLAGGEGDISSWSKVVNVKASGAPQMLKAATNAAGTVIALFFDQPMADPAGNEGQFSATVNGEPCIFNDAVLNPGDPARIELTLADRVDYDDEIMVNYTAGNVSSAGDESLESFAGRSVTNHTPSGNRIAGGRYHSLALKADGTVATWGEASDGLGSVPPELTGVVDLTGGNWHSLALKTDGKVAFWGWTNRGVDGVASLNDVALISSGYEHALALKSDGTVAAWGRNVEGQRDVPPSLGNVVAVAGGYWHSLALEADGTVAAWGWNEDGQCDIPGELNDAVAVAGGYYHSLALRQDGTVTAWGNNTYGQCSAPEGLGDVVAIAAGAWHSLALKADGTVATWGYNGNGQCAILPDLSDVAAIAAGYHHSLAMKSDGTVIASDTPAVAYNKGQCDVPSVLNLTGGLSNLQLNPVPLAPSFDADTTAYAMNVDFDVDSLEITGTLENNGHLLQIKGQTAEDGAAEEVALNPGENVIPITVSIPGIGLTRTYTLTVTRSAKADSFAVSAPARVKAGKIFGVQLIALDPSGETETNYNGEHNIDWSWAAVDSPNGTPPVKPQDGVVAFADGVAVVEGFMLTAAGEEVIIATVNEDNAGGESSAITVDTGAAATLGMEPLGGEIVSGQPFDVKVTVLADKYGNPGAGFTGTVAFASNDPQVQLPARYTFQIGDTVGGVCSKAFSNLAFSRFGNLTLWVSEVINDESPDGYWRFDEGAGTVAADLSGSLSAGTLFNVGSGGGAWVKYDVGNDEPAIQFDNPSGLKLDGLNDYINTGDGVNLADRSFTIAFWAKRTGLTEGWIVSQGTVVKNLGLHVGFYSSNTFRLGFWHNDLDVPAPLDNDWHHWAVTYDRSTGLQRVYRNGAAVGSRASDGVLEVSGPFYIGKRFDDYEGGYFEGELDDLRVYYRMLPEGEIAVLAGGEGAISSWDKGITAFAVDPDVPKMLKAATNAAGTAASLFFDQAMADPAGKEGQFGATVNGEPRAFSAVVLNPDDPARIDLILTGPVEYGDKVEASYIAGSVESAAGELLESFAGKPVTNFVLFHITEQRIAAGWRHSLAVKSDGTVTTWGEGGWGLSGVPSGLSGVVALTGGEWHSLALKSDHTSVGWGLNNYGQRNVEQLINVAAVSAGAYHSLALKPDGTVVASGWNYYGQCNVPELVGEAVAVSAGLTHSLAVKPDGAVAAWGYNGYGQCNVPTDLSDVVAIAAGGWNSLALKSNGTVVAWGDNTNYQLNIPAGLGNVVAIAAGGVHSLALKSDGTVTAWGRNVESQCSVPAGLSNVVAVAAGYSHSLALKSDGTVVAWGDNGNGQLNIPDGLILQSWTEDEEIMAAKRALTWNSISGTNSTADNITANLILPLAGAYGTSIEWYVNPDEGWIGPDSGQVTCPTYSQGDRDVILTAVISKGSGTDQTKTFNLTVKAAEMSADEAISLELAALTWETIRGSNKEQNNIVGNLAPLPETGTSGASIEWNVDTDEGWINPDTGEVTRPTYSQGDRSIILTVTISKAGGASLSKSFSLTVKAADMTADEAIALDIAALDAADILNGNSALDNITGDLLLPLAGVNGTKITWSAQPTGWINETGGTVVRPGYSRGDITVVLTATVGKEGGTSLNKAFGLIIKTTAKEEREDEEVIANYEIISNIYATLIAGTYNQSYSVSINEAKGITMVSLTNQVLNEAFKMSGTDGNGALTVTVKIPAVKGTETYELRLPAAVLATGNGEKKIEVKSEIGTISLPDNMLEGLGLESIGNVSISIGKIDKMSLPQDLRDQIGSRPVIQLSLSAGRTIAWNNEEAPVTLSIPYTPTPQELADPEHITVWYIDGQGNVVEVPSGRYDPVTGTVTFSTTHFSNYAVVYVHRTFGDLGSAAWAKKAVEVLASKGILKGITEKKYAPQAGITRADFLYFLMRILGLEKKFDVNFSDVSSDAYYYKEIGIARKLGITGGTGGNKFNPDTEITRQDMMVMTVRALKLLNKLEVQGEASDLDRFADRALIVGYAAESAAALVKNGLMIGSGGKLNPLGNTTRAEAALFLYRIYNRSVK